MSCETILAELDREQRRAATAETNAVVAAGAGSGKTKVLAARYAWLVMEKKIPVDQILTLTFTNKAVSEMYSRIYGLLGAERDNPEARRGIANFHQARISTLDAFCGQVARSAARRYGLGPGFTSDEAGVRELAMEASLPFVLEHRENPSLQLLLSSKKIKTVAEELFAETVLRHSPLSKPLDFSAFIKIQNDELLREWRVKSAAAAELAGLIKAELEGAAKKSGAVYENLQRALQKPLPPAPDLEPLLGEGRETGELRKEITAYFECINRLKSVSLRGKAPEGLAGAVEGIKTLRDPLSGELESIANMALQSGIARAVFPLVEEFQNRFNRKKREAGILTFNDIAHLAVDALSRYPDIRQVYKDAYRAIMIDEFQDNNGLQRDLIFLLAEKPERRDRGVPGPGELSPDKMFFVGDEKQSIYRFRGADVSVFRRLARDLAGGGAEGSGGLSLVHNYRSRPILIEAFNRIFGGSGPGQPGLSPQPGVFLPEGPELADFEAAYSRLRSPGELGAEDLKNPPVHFCFLDRGGLAKEAPPGGRGLEAEELEAAFIAGKIREMVEGAYPVPVREKGETGVRPCGYGDFAILERSYRRQGTLEKQCKLFGVPFNADRPAGLFNDAPINDLYHLLRLLAYPQDRLSYAALIRSPFTRLGDLTLTVCMLNHRDPETGLPRRPFDEALDGIVPPEERERYREARRRFEALVEAARTLSLTGLLTKLWFDEGCRYETLWSAPAQVYGELFDLFFEIARQCAEGGKALPDFIDYLAGLISQEERAGDLEVPAEEETGVRIMSVHKSKGLEFPVVFVYGSGGRGAKQTNTESFFFSEQWGITLNLPPAEELGGGAATISSPASGNWNGQRRRRNCGGSSTSP
jgi:ATP-dependent helicase/nuclease subunit A